MSELLLVSESPRRRQILTEAGFLFRVDTVKISEITEENVNPESEIMRLAQTKGEAYVKANNHLISQDILLLSADTMVVVDNKALGKPKNSTEAVQFLSNLSSRVHRVITAIYVLNLQSGEKFLGTDQTEVEFRKLSQDEILAYVATGESLDKAGAYAIQGGGGKFVSQIRGSYKNVVGLPVELLEKVLREKGWNVSRQL
jgi:septum formation protein